MSRFVFRYVGAGSAPTADLEALRRKSGIAIVDATPHMALVEGEEESVKAAAQVMPDWQYAAERGISLPDPRPKIRKGNGVGKGGRS
jgi:hypothetical protein